MFDIKANFALLTNRARLVKAEVPQSEGDRLFPVPLATEEDEESGLVPERAPPLATEIKDSLQDEGKAPEVTEKKIAAKNKKATKAVKSENKKAKTWEEAKEEISKESSVSPSE